MSTEEKELQKELKKQMKVSDSVLQGKIPPNQTNQQNPKVVNPDDWLGEPVIEEITAEQVRQLYPIKLSKKAYEQSAQLINECINSTEAGLEEFVKSNIVGFMNVVSQVNNINMKEYLNAVKFTTYRQAGDNITRAYARTFPDKLKRMQEEGLPTTYLHAYATTFSKTQLVVAIQAQMLIPTHLMYQDVFHQAVSTLTTIMTDDSVSPKVRVDAGGILISNLKSPEAKKAELTLNVKESNVISELGRALEVLSNTQGQALQNGKISMQDLRQATIIEVEPEVINEQ